MTEVISTQIDSEAEMRPSELDVRVVLGQNARDAFLAQPNPHIEAQVAIYEEVLHAKVKEGALTFENPIESIAKITGWRREILLRRGAQTARNLAMATRKRQYREKNS